MESAEHEERVRHGSEKRRCAPWSRIAIGLADYRLGDSDARVEPFEEDRVRQGECSIPSCRDALSIRARPTSAFAERGQGRAAAPMPSSKIQLPSCAPPCPRF